MTIATELSNRTMVQVLGTGYFKPDKILTNADMEKIVETSDEWIVARTGIRERRIVEPDVATSDIAIEASRMALANAGVDPEELDLIILGTASPDMLTPSTACFVQAGIGAKNAAAFDLSAGCTGFLYALVTAEKFMSDPAINKVLVIGAETLSKVVNWTDRTTCVIFADGAGAMVLGKGTGASGILSSKLTADGNYADLITIAAGGSRYPASHETVDKNMHTIKMAGQEVFKYAVKAVPECADRVLEQAGLTIDDVDFIVLHQANTRIIDAAGKRLNAPESKMLTNIQYVGNTSSASVPLLLAEAEEAGTIKPGDLVLTVAFGAGMTTGAAVIRWGHSAKQSI